MISCTCPAPRTERPPGARIAGRYVVEEMLARGGLGAVYLVTDALRDDRRLTLRELRAERLSEERRVTVARELGARTLLRHPNLAAVYDLSPPPACWYTMEYVEGVPLDAAELTAGELVEATVQLCRALEVLHQGGLVHGDVRPANIVVRRTDGELLVKLTDVAAPEVSRGPGGDGRADQYALGKTLMALDGPLPPSLERVVERMTRLDPDERFDSAAQVIEALRASPVDRVAPRRDAGDVLELATLAYGAFAAPVTAAVPQVQMVVAGKRWRVKTDATEISVRDSRGMRYLAVLMGRPGVEIHVEELVGLAATSTAHGDDDPARGEKLRQSVTKRLRDAVRKIASMDPALGAYLDGSVHTGIRCAYVPVPIVGQPRRA